VGTGHSAQQNLILVSLTGTDDTVRILSARKATRTERKTIKKTLVRKKRPAKQDALRPEYRFDYSKSKPNRFAAEMSETAVAVVLEPDVAAVFKSSEAVNALLRSVISAMPSKRNQAR